MQEVAQLYTSMPRDVSSWCMPISWQVPQEGNNVNNFIGMILLFNWTHGCHILFLVLNLEYYLKNITIGTGICIFDLPCQLFLLQGFCSL